jgi:hypothetical protein
MKSVDDGLSVALPRSHMVAVTCYVRVFPLIQFTYGMGYAAEDRQDFEDGNSLRNRKRNSQRKTQSATTSDDVRLLCSNFVRL